MAFPDEEKVIGSEFIPMSGYRTGKADADVVGTGAEVAFLVVKVSEWRRKNIKYQNNDVGAHTLKVYGSFEETIPNGLSDVELMELTSAVVAAGVDSGPLVYENDYTWMVISVNAPNTEVGKIKMIASRDS